MKIIWARAVPVIFQSQETYFAMHWNDYSSQGSKKQHSPVFQLGHLPRSKRNARHALKFKGNKTTLEYIQRLAAHHKKDQARRFVNF